MLTLRTAALQLYAARVQLVRCGRRNAAGPFALAQEFILLGNIMYRRHLEKSDRTLGHSSRKHLNLRASAQANSPRGGTILGGHSANVRLTGIGCASRGERGCLDYGLVRHGQAADIPWKYPNGRMPLCSPCLPCCPCAALPRGISSRVHQPEVVIALLSPLLGVLVICW